MRLTIISTILTLLAATTTQAEWIHEPDKDALSTPSLGNSSQAKADLVVVCNNMVRLTYVRWYSDFGIEKKKLPSHVTVDYSLSGAADNSGQVWTISRPEENITQMITHDLLLPQQLTTGEEFFFSSAAKEGVPATSAQFDLTNLQSTIYAHHMPCRGQDVFPLKMLHEQEAEAAEAEASAKAAAQEPKPKKRIPPPPLPNFDP